MILPLGTDAPVYHRPWATFGLIVANVAALVWAQNAPAADVAPWILTYGQWSPRQWISSVFLHAGWLHLIGNMVFLWVFGLVVEGKIGGLRFLALYGAIAVLSGAVEQSLLFSSEGGSLGASGVIYGLIAVALVWAPENDVSCLFLFVPFVFKADVSIRKLSLFYLATELLWAAFGGFSLSSSVLHLLGAAAGLPIGILMLKRGWVDCEGWDWFSRRAGRVASLGKGSRSAQPALALGRVASAVPQWTPAEPVRRVEARPVVAEVVEAETGNPVAALRKAEFLLRERRPAKAGEVLAAIRPRLADERQRRACAVLQARAAQLVQAGVIELE